MANEKSTKQSSQEKYSGIWTDEKVLTYFDDPTELLQDPAMQQWVATHGWIEEVDQFFRQQRLTKADEKVLTLLLDTPMQPTSYYAEQLGIVLSSYYRRRKDLAHKLAICLNLWESDHSSSFPEISSPPQHNGHSSPKELPKEQSRETPLTNLPMPTAPIFGREQDLLHLQLLLQNEQVRHITLTGPGGVGKTRLSLQIGVATRSYFEAGIWFVNLAAVTNPSMVPSAIAQVLGLKDSHTTATMLKQLKLSLRDRSLLIILDNLEQCVTAAAIIDEILDAAHNVKILVTSRIPLRTRYEHEIVVDPLSIPTQHRLPPLAVLACTPVVQLFIERAESVRSGLVLTSDNAATIVAICRRLEGLPLGIELAAARTRVLSPSDILQRLEQRLKLLTGKAAHLPPRQQTMRNAIAWSYELLTPDEQLLFARLSVFVGGWTATAAEAICQTDDDIDVLSGLESLLDSSLIRYDDYEGIASTPRFIMLETIREFAQEQLAAEGKHEHYQQRHLIYFHTFANQAEPMLAHENQVVWLGLVEQESDNVRAALDYALQSRQSTLALQIGSALWLFWLVGGHLAEGRRWLERAIEQADLAPIEIEAKALLVAGNLTFNLMDHAAGQTYVEESLSLSRQAGDIALTAMALRNLGKCYMLQGKYDEAQVFVEESLELFRSLDPVEFARDLGWTLNTLGYLLAQHGQTERALALYEEAVSTVLPTGDKHAISWFLTSVADIVYKRGDYDRAQAQYTECLVLRRVLGDKWGCAWALCALGNVALMKKQVNPQFFMDSLVLYQELENSKGMLANLMGLAQMACLSGDHLRAARINGAIEAVAETTEINFDVVERQEYEQYKIDMQVLRTDADTALAQAEGKHMTLDDIVDFVLNRHMTKDELAY